MDTSLRRTTLRILAPLALIAAGIALFLIVSSFDNSGSGSGSSSKNSAQEARDLGTSTTSSKTRKKHSTRGKLPQSTYIVKSGDTLGSISQTTGVPVEKLQSLNPNLDQFSLVAGQKIKIR
jgi:LysM repeat protein